MQCNVSNTQQGPILMSYLSITNEMCNMNPVVVLHEAMYLRYVLHHVQLQVGTALKHVQGQPAAGQQLLAFSSSSGWHA